MRQLDSADRPGAARAARLLRPVAAALAIGLIASVAAAAAAAGQPDDDDTLEWLDDYQAALARAQETGRPLLVEFRCAP